LLPEPRARFGRRLAALGPDVLADEFDAERFLRRLRADDPTRPIGDALLDQKTVAGIGNLWKAESLWEAGVSPWRATADVSDADALAVIAAARPPMLASATHGHTARARVLHGRAGRPCPRCGARIRIRGQGDDNRRTF